MDKKGVRTHLTQSAFYIPFTLYFFLFAVSAITAWRILHNYNQENDTAFADIFTLLLKVAGLFAVVLLALALATVSFSAVYFLLKRKKGETVFRISTGIQEKEQSQKQQVDLFISPVLKPLFGFVKLRLLYDVSQVSDKFSLVGKRQNTLLSSTIEGSYNWELPAIKEYHVQKAVLYFEDVFQFFSIAVDLPANSLFFKPPRPVSRPSTRVLPRKTEETTTRIEELRKVEGEYLNYKNFENNDDVRRIVWKIYAKNKELVVRVPEIMDPYASHIYLYASFYTHFNVAGSKPVEIPFLNYFKMMTWTVYEDLVKQGFEVRYVPDQEVATRANDKQQVKYNISTSRWQTGNNLKAYCKTRDASIVVISSLSDPQHVQELVEQHGNEITFILVKLTESLKKQHMLDWVQWLFVQHEKSDIEVYRSAWATAFTLRPKIVENEARLMELLEKYQVRV